MTKVMDLVPKEGNLAGNVISQNPSPSVTKKSMTEVHKKSLQDPKASAKAQHGKGTFNGSNTTDSGRRSD